MTELLRLFQQIASTAEEITLQEASSQEIKDSAFRLSQTIQPCLSELQRSANILEKLLQPCLDELTQAEAVWSSKPKIVQSCTALLHEEGLRRGEGW